ncbi:hypothetical protein Lal_00040288 [Lupinus albus]|nr:hypothetical protein Lal_00040288 [Lupinus albus]
MILVFVAGTRPESGNGRVRFMWLRLTGYEFATEKNVNLAERYTPEHGLCFPLEQEHHQHRKNIWYVLFIIGYRHCDDAMAYNNYKS